MIKCGFIRESSVVTILSLFYLFTVLCRKAIPISNFWSMFLSNISERIWCKFNQNTKNSIWNKILLCINAECRMHLGLGESAEANIPVVTQGDSRVPAHGSETDSRKYNKKRVKHTLCDIRKVLLQSTWNFVEGVCHYIRWVLIENLGWENITQWCENKPHK